MVKSVYINQVNNGFIVDVDYNEVITGGNGFNELRQERYICSSLSKVTALLKEAFPKTKAE
jgi:hypothetical protein